MILAKNNIIVKIQNSSKTGCMASNGAQRNDQHEYAILNPISGSFDLMDEIEYTSLQKISEMSMSDEAFSSYLLERGYVFNNQEEETAAINKAYDEFNDEIKQSQVQLMLVPTYGCNLACTYCYQGRGTHLKNSEMSLIENGVAGRSASMHCSPCIPDGKPTLIPEETVDAFF